LVAIKRIRFEIETFRRHDPRIQPTKKQSSEYGGIVFWHS